MIKAQFINIIGADDNAELPVQLANETGGQPTTSRPGNAWERIQARDRFIKEVRDYMQREGVNYQTAWNKLIKDRPELS